MNPSSQQASAASPIIPSGLQTQINTIDSSLNAIMAIIIGTAIAYYSTCMQKKQLIYSVMDPKRAACLPDIFPFQLTSNLLILPALMFFYCLSSQTLINGSDDCTVRRFNEIGNLASLLVLLAASLRFGTLLNQSSASTFSIESTQPAIA